MVCGGISIACLTP
ncbi:DUF3265 domain-containing protein [Vibrio vulnificus]|nr:DUF3265 domain-containing protein [Vibrio vulnificus]